MLKSKLSRWLMRAAFTLAAVAVMSVLSAEQANAQYYGGGRGISIGSFGRGGGVSVNFGGYGNRGYGGRGYSSYGRGYSRGGSSYYRPSYGGAYRGRGGYGSSYGRGGFRY